VNIFDDTNFVNGEGSVGCRRSVKMMKLCGLAYVHQSINRHAKKRFKRITKILYSLHIITH